jgi:hypothetical protein
MEIEPFLAPWIVSNAIALLLLIAALPWARFVRWSFVVIFLAAGIFNTYTAFTEPGVYLDYAERTFLPFYRDFILGSFSQYTTAYVVAIAVGQLTVAILLALPRRFLQLGVVGGTVFLIAIAPLGVGSAFPCTLIMTAALWVMLGKLRAGATIRQ